MMPGVAFEEIRDAIVDAFTRDELDETLRTLMNLRLEVVTTQSGFGHQVFELIGWAEKRGLDSELVRVVARARPGNPKVQAIYKKYGMAIPVYVERAGAELPGSPMDATDGGLEKIVRPHLSFAEFGIWRERMTEVEARVCLITLAGAARGTGFLVGPDVVLTNWHVMEPVLVGTRVATEMECVFDFKRLADGTISSTPLRLHATEWNIDSSPYSKLEGDGRPDEGDPSPDELDYSLVRLVEAVGDKPWAANPKPNGGAPLRGWVPLPDAPYPFQSPTGVIIAQHPAGWPLKLAIDTAAIDKASGHWLNANGTRVRYATNTLGGSSGSPVFDLEWSLIALHHYGDPVYGHRARYNQGIPAAQIRDRLRCNGKESALASSARDARQEG